MDKIIDKTILSTIDKVALIFLGGLISFVLGHLTTIYIMLYIPIE